jgi:hypothetical protein
VEGADVITRDRYQAAAERVARQRADRAARLDELAAAAVPLEVLRALRSEPLSDRELVAVVGLPARIVLSELYELERARLVGRPSWDHRFMLTGSGFALLEDGA